MELKLDVVRRVIDWKARGRSSGFLPGLKGWQSILATALALQRRLSFSSMGTLIYTEVHTHFNPTLYGVGGRGDPHSRRWGAEQPYSKRKCIHENLSFLVPHTRAGEFGRIRRRCGKCTVRISDITLEYRFCWKCHVHLHDRSGPGHAYHCRRPAHVLRLQRNA